MVEGSYMRTVPKGPVLELGWDEVGGYINQNQIFIRINIYGLTTNDVTSWYVTVTDTAVSARNFSLAFCDHDHC